jgi:hypothetical protein
VAAGLQQLAVALRASDAEQARRAHARIAAEQAALAAALARLKERCPPPRVPA